MCNELYTPMYLKMFDILHVFNNHNFVVSLVQTN